MFVVIVVKRVSVLVPSELTNFTVSLEYGATWTGGVYSEVAAGATTELAGIVDVTTTVVTEVIGT